MALVVHLSDLHLNPLARSQPALLDALVRTLARDVQPAPGDRTAIVITGDVFDSAELPPAAAVSAFLALHGRMVSALGGTASTIVVPGNHDRRRYGLLGPPRGTLFQALIDAADPTQIYVAGRRAPHLAEVVPETLHQLPFHVVAYDSTYLPGGLFSAGGTLRIEDLLMAHSDLPSDGRPLLVLTHHHLIPTPLTDLSHIDSAGSSRLVRWAIADVLPAMISYGDREELTMTAMGAGTVLSTLHALGRAVLLLHGHKHVPTARLVAGMTGDCGDLLIASAGSAATRERVHPARHPDAARLWPSFNVVQLGEDSVHIEALAFAPKSATRPPVRRELASARVTGPKWKPAPVSFRVKDPAPRIDLDEATYTLTSVPARPAFWDYACVRRVMPCEGAQLRRYVDFIHSVPRTVGSRARPRRVRRIELTLGAETHYGERAALCRTLAAAAEARGQGTAFESVGLLCRYGAKRATLELMRRGAAGVKPFGSFTDLTIGRERPVRVETTEDAWTIRVESCAPRSLLRLYWPLGPA
jgi:3',5'-cyclic AMP phosphodiesterase CpdA